MKAALAVVVIVAAGLGVSAIAIRLGDRGTLTAPPDAVVESFARDLAERRFDLTAKYLSQALRHSIRAETIRAKYAAPVGALGEVNAVDAELEWMDRNRASAKATIRADAGSLTLRARLIWESAGWVLETLPESEARMPR